MSGRNEDNAAQARLAAAVGVAREQWPDAAALARVQRGVAGAIGAGAPSVGPAHARLLRQSTRAAWLRGGSMALLLGAGFGAWRIAAGAGDAAAVQAQPAVASALVSAASPVATAVPAAPILPVGVVVNDAPLPIVQVVAGGETRRKLRARVARASERHAGVHAAVNDAALDPESELALLRRALGSLQARPSQSLELAAEHERVYAEGIFGQEREVIAIDALLALQRTGAAEARARAFLSDYPRSAHAPRIRAMLGGDRERPRAAAKVAAKLAPSTEQAGP